LKKPAKGKIMTTIKIKGMSCQHCVGATRKALEAIPGISDVTIDLDKGTASFTGTVAPQTVKDAVSKIGFEVIQ
jgi:copper chaperone